MLYDFTLYPIESILESMLIIFIALTGSTFWSIVVLAISVRLLTKPLEKITSVVVRNQTQFEAVLSPQLAAIKSEHSGSQRHDAITRLYQRYSYHPIFAVRSLLGLLVQLPFFIAAYFMLSSFTGMSGVMIPVLGDLGVPDTLLFGRFHLLPFIMTLVNILALVTTGNSDRRSLVQGLILSFGFLVLLYESPLGLIIYWTTSNLVSLSSNLIPRLAEKVPVKISLPSFKGSGVERFFEEYAYIFFVVNLAILVPLLGVLGGQFNLFTAHGITGGAIISLLIYGVLLPSIVLSLLRGLAKLLGAAKAFDGLILVVFIGIFLTYLFNKAGYGILGSDYEPAILFLTALLVTAGAVAIILNTGMLRKLSYFSLMIPLVLLHFIFVSPASTLFAGSGGMSGEKPDGINDTPVFLIVFDEFSGLTLQTPDGSLDVLRYPGFAEIASSADYYPNALTVDYHTSIAVPSMLSGTMRLGGAVGPLSTAGELGLASGENLLDLYKSWGGGVRAGSSILSADLTDEKKTDQFSLASDLATLYLHIVLHQDWIEKKIGVIPSAWKDFGIFYNADDEIDSSIDGQPAGLDAYFDWLAKVEVNAADKQFNFLHLDFPHVPYVTTATGRRQSNSRAFLPQLITKESFAADQPLINVSYHNYLQQSAYAGVLLGKIIDVLKDAGLYDKSLVIVTADHGVSYSAEGLNRREPDAQESLANIVSVPLFIKYPFQADGNVKKTFVSILDIAPTIMDVTEVAPPWDLTGESLKTVGDKTLTSSVAQIHASTDYFENFSDFFDSSRARKNALFGVGSPVTQVAVNYTEDPMYSGLLNTDVSTYLVEELSDLDASWRGSVRPSELTHYGRVYLAGQPQNGKVIAAVVNNKILAVFVSGSIKGQGGYFAFSLPETEIVPAELAVSLYEVGSGVVPVMKKLRQYRGELALFQEKTRIEYDWESAVQSTNGVDSLTVEEDAINVLVSSGNDPYLVMQSISDLAISEPVIRIELESSKDLILQLFYQSVSESGFSESRSQTFQIYQGDNVAYFEIPDTEVSGEFRLDLGPGDFTEIDIDDIEIRY